MTPQTYVFHAGTTMEMTVRLDDVGLRVKYPSKEVVLEWNCIIGAGVAASKIRASNYLTQKSPTSRLGRMAHVYNSATQVVIGYKEKKGQEHAMIVPLSNGANEEDFIRTLRERLGAKWLSGLELHYESLKWMNVRPMPVSVSIALLLAALLLLGWWTGFIAKLVTDLNR